MDRICSRKAVLYDVANLAYVVGDVREGDYSAHSLHHTFDICAEGNIDRVSRVLDLGIAEVEALLHDHGYWRRRGRDDASRKLMKRLVHEYLVAKVLADWLEVAFPGSVALVRSSATKSGGDNPSAVWKEKMGEAYRALTAHLVTLQAPRCAFRRRVSPI